MKKYLKQLALVALFALIIVSIMFFAMDLYPFNEKSVIVKDQKYQYIQLYSYYQHALQSQDSLLYSLNSGLGMNFFGVVGYYLSSPLLLLLKFVPNDYLAEFINLITMLRFILLACSFHLFIYYRFKDLDNSIKILLSLAFAFCSYNIAYMENMMWMDAIICFPIILFALERFIENNRKWLLFVLMVGLTYLTNFYIAYIISLGVIIYFVIRIVELDLTKKEIINMGLKLFLYALLGVGLACFILGPTYLQISLTKSRDVLGYSNSHMLEGLMARMLLGNEEVNNYDVESYMGIYSLTLSGSAPHYMASTFGLFLVNSYLWYEHKTKEKIVFLSIIGLFFLSFMFEPFYLFFHAFTKNIGFDHRHAFLLAFFILYYGACNALKIKEEGMFKHYLSTFILLGVLLAINIYLGVMYKFPLTYFLVQALLIIIYTIFFTIDHKKYCIPFLGIELVYLFVMMMNLFSFQFNVDFDQDRFENNINDHSLFRTENIEESYKNDFDNQGYLNDYYTVSHFTSLNNFENMQYLKQLGLNTTKGFNKIKYYGNTLLTDQILGIKYIVENNPPHRLNYDYYNSSNGYEVYENHNFASFGLKFYCDNVDFINIVDYQNDLINCLGYNQPLLKEAKIENGKINLEGTNQVYLVVDDSLEAGLKNITANGDDVYYVSDAYKGNIDLGFIDLGVNNGNIDLMINHTVQYNYDKIKAYYYNESEYNQFNQFLKANNGDVQVAFSNRNFILTNDTNETQKILLPVQYDKGFRFSYETKVDKILDMFYLIEVNPHSKLTMTYTPNGLNAGIVISFISMVIIGFLKFIQRKD